MQTSTTGMACWTSSEVDGGLARFGRGWSRNGTLIGNGASGRNTYPEVSGCSVASHAFCSWLRRSLTRWPEWGTV